MVVIRRTPPAPQRRLASDRISSGPIWSATFRRSDHGSPRSPCVASGPCSRIITPGLLNAAEFARALGVDGKTVASYLDLMVDLLLARRREPWHSNTGKRLVKSPRVYVRDSGIVHGLLGLQTLDDVPGHAVSGASWEGFVIESVLSAMPDGARANFYRSAAGAEVDLVLTLPGGRKWAIEIKRSLAPKVERGFHHACEHLRPARRLVVCPGAESFPLGDGIEATPLRALGQELLALSR